MVALKTKRYLPYFAKNVLQTLERARVEAAWQLLCAVRELFPERFNELHALEERLASEYVDELDEEHEDNKEARDRFWRTVEDWTARNGISCPAVNDAAAKYAVGDLVSPGVYLDAYFDEKGEFVRRQTPSITARPYDETRPEFLKRAGQYYDDLAQQYAVRDKVKRGPVKRERDYVRHFRYLAARLVGGLSFAEIARQHDVPEKTVAGEARKLAHLIGLSPRAVPGPRPGSHPRPAVHRVRR